MAYLVDANVLIGGKNLHYGFDFCPGFWTWLSRANEAGVVRSVVRVREEIARQEDELSRWVRHELKGLFLSPRGSDGASLELVSDWVASREFESQEVSAFFQQADYHLIGQAHAGKHTVVTHEVAAPQAQKIKIPDVCKALKVPCWTPFRMLRHEKARLVLDPGSQEALKGRGPVDLFRGHRP